MAEMDHKELELQAWNEAFENHGITFSDAMTKMTDSRIDELLENQNDLKYPFNPLNVSRSWTSYGSSWAPPDNRNTFYEMDLDKASCPGYLTKFYRTHDGEIFRQSADGTWEYADKKPLDPRMLFCGLGTLLLPFLVGLPEWLAFPLLVLGGGASALTFFLPTRVSWEPATLKYSSYAKQQVAELRKDMKLIEGREDKKSTEIATVDSSRKQVAEKSEQEIVIKEATKLHARVINSQELATSSGKASVYVSAPPGASVKITIS